MRITGVLILLTAFLSYPIRADEQPDSLPDNLWNQAVSLYADSRSLVPGRMSVVITQYNGRGRLISSQETEYLISLDENGEVVSTVVASREEGEQPEQQDRPAGEENGGFEGIERSPFDPDEQSSVSVERSGETVTVNGIRTQPYSYRHQTGPDTAMVGTAWLSVADGAPVAISYTMEPLPRLVDHFEVRQTFQAGELGLTVESVEFEGSGRFLFFRRRVESRLVFSEYFRVPE
jgi:hypothetical protein